MATGSEEAVEAPKGEGSTLEKIADATKLSPLKMVVCILLITVKVSFGCSPQWGFNCSKMYPAAGGRSLQHICAPVTHIIRGISFTFYFMGLHHVHGGVG